MTTEQRAAELFQRVLVPLVSGGALIPSLPTGPRLADSLASEHRDLSLYEGSSWFEVLRVRKARLLCPVDTLETISRDQWLMAAAFSDLLQCANPELNGVLASGRALSLLDSVEETLSLATTPQSSGEALSRHGSFARILEVERTDTQVQWWCGSASFQGREPPKRMLTWPGLRRVSQSQKSVSLTSICLENQLPTDRFAKALQKLIELSPLTDLATATRKTPKFTITLGIFALMSTSAGWTIGMRALMRNGCAGAIASMQAASSAGIGKSSRLQDFLKAVLSELGQRQEYSP